MNRSSTRAVLPIYKEGRAITAHLSRSMQEWILTQTGGEPEAAEVRREMAQAEADAAGRREWESLLAENAPLAFRVARGVLRNDADAQDVARRLCCVPTTGSKGYANARVSARGWFESVFALHWTGCAPANGGRRGKRNGYSKILVVRCIRTTAPSFSGSSTMRWTNSRRSSGWFFSWPRWRGTRWKKFRRCLGFLSAPSNRGCSWREKLLRRNCDVL
jgi:hypothetical protein